MAGASSHRHSLNRYKATAPVILSEAKNLSVQREILRFAQNDRRGDYSECEANAYGDLPPPR